MDNMEQRDKAPAKRIKTEDWGGEPAATQPKVAAMRDEARADDSDDDMDETDMAGLSKEEKR